MPADVIARRGSRRRILDGTRVRFRKRDQFGDGVRRNGRMGGNHERHIDRGSDRREIAYRVVRQSREDLRVDRHRGRSGEQQRVTVRCRFGGCFRAEDSAGAGAVIDHHLLTDALAQFERNAAGDNVRRAARRVRHDEAYRFDGIALA
jgi:hypothetical protein